MYEFSTPMALTDFIPVLLFGVAAVLMQRDFYNKMPKYAFACFAAGCVNVFLAGFLKATWKLLYAAGICDFHVLNTMFLPVQSIGLLLTGFGLILMLTARKKAALAVAPPVFSGTFVFITMMVAGLGAMCASRDGRSSAMNWIEQGVNTLGQALLLFGVTRLHRDGLRDFKL